MEWSGVECLACAYQHEKNTYQHEKNTYQHVDQRSGLETPGRYAKKHRSGHKKTQVGVPRGGRGAFPDVFFCIFFRQVSSPEMLHVYKLTLSLAPSSN